MSDEASNASSLHFFANNTVLFVNFFAIFVPHLPIATGTCKKVVKS